MNEDKQVSQSSTAPISLSFTKLSSKTIKESDLEASDFSFSHLIKNFLSDIPKREYFVYLISFITTVPLLGYLVNLIGKSDTPSNLSHYGYFGTVLLLALSITGFIVSKRNFLKIPKIVNLITIVFYSGYLFILWLSGFDGYANMALAMFFGFVVLPFGITYVISLVVLTISRQKNSKY